MEERPHALLLKFPGTNCDVETSRALETVGFTTEVVPISKATNGLFKRPQLVVLSGGFSYGDYVMAGRLAQLETELRLGETLREFRDGGGYLLGICNGFQILTKLGLLPEGSLIHNTSGRFICRWAELRKQNGENPFLQELPESFELPVAHAEGRFVAPDGRCEDYLAQGLVALTYGEDINGSSCAIAGIQDESGRVLGLMPHPERFLHKAHHYDPDWDGDDEWGWGYYFFKSIHERIIHGEGALA
ncbi:MAG: phosphoribosylformylglycinamidine synthase I [Verrucomicrobiales bacterium]